MRVGCTPSISPKATEAVIPSASPVQGDASVLWLKLFQTQKCPRDLFVIPGHSGVALGASSSLVARGVSVLLQTPRSSCTHAFGLLISLSVFPPDL